MNSHTIRDISSLALTDAKMKVAICVLWPQASAAASRAPSVDMELQQHQVHLLYLLVSNTL
jgi:hypothetical protein